MNAEEVVFFDSPKALNNMTGEWIKLYRKNPYLRELTIQDLSDREADIAQNMMRFDEVRQKYVPIFNIGKDGIYRPVRNLDWLRMYTEVYEEFRSRGTKALKLPSMAEMFDCQKRLLKTQAVRPKLIEASKQSMDNYELPKLLFRYSKRKYNEEFLKKGMLRISLSSIYGDSTLLRSQRDQEAKMDIPKSERVFETDDFYTVCFSSLYSYRMYCEFSADSCVVIRNIEEFKKRFLKSIRIHNSDAANIRISRADLSPIFYYDPLNILLPTEGREIALSKPFRFAYQHEFRVALLPSKPSQLKSFDIELGPLDDIAELVLTDVVN